MALAAGLATVLLLQLLAIRGQSLVSDAPYHLLAGHQALRYGQNTLNLEHPPLVKLLAALPLLVEPPLALPLGPRSAFPAAFAIFDEPGLANRVRFRSRVVLLISITIPLLASLWLLGRGLWGSTAGWALLLLTGLAFSVFPYLTTLQTDGGCALGFAAALAGAVWLQRRPAPASTLLLGVGVGLALASKFSGLLLVPVLVLALWIAPAGGRRRLALGILAALCAFTIPAASYAVANRHADESTMRQAIGDYMSDRNVLGVGDRLRPWKEGVLSLHEISPAAAQYAVGVLGVGARNRIGVFPSYAFGRVSSRGRWWYFPAVLVVKLPLALLATTLAALAAASRRTRRSEIDPERRRGVWLCALAAGIYLLTAVTSNYNLGMRHLLPVAPLLLLPAAWWVARRSKRLVLVATILAVESLVLAPNWIAATNTWWLGSRNPTRLALSHSNFECHQSFLSLARDTESRGLEPLRVLYPGLRAEELGAYLPDATLVSPADPPSDGWYAVSAALDQMLPALLPEPPPDLHNRDAISRAAAHWEPVWTEIRSRCASEGWVAGSFLLYHCPGSGE